MTTRTFETKELVTKEDQAEHYHIHIDDYDETISALEAEPNPFLRIEDVKRVRDNLASKVEEL